MGKYVLLYIAYFAMAMVMTQQPVSIGLMVGAAVMATPGWIAVVWVSGGKW